MSACRHRRPSGQGGPDPSDPLQQLLADTAAVAAALAPMQHRMWRAYLIQQLRSLSAACEVGGAAGMPSTLLGP